MDPRFRGDDNGTTRIAVDQRGIRVVTVIRKEIRNSTQKVARVFEEMLSKISPLSRRQTLSTKVIPAAAPRHSHESENLYLEFTNISNIVLTSAVAKRNLLRHERSSNHGVLKSVTTD